MKLIATAGSKSGLPVSRRWCFQACAQTCIRGVFVVCVENTECRYYNLFGGDAGKYGNTGTPVESQRFHNRVYGFTSHLEV